MTGEASEAPSLASVVVEASSLSAKVVSYYASFEELGERLEYLGRALSHSNEVLTGDSSADEIRALTAKVRSVVALGLTVLADLQAQAGKLEALAWIREAGECCDE